MNSRLLRYSNVVLAVLALSGTVRVAEGADNPMKAEATAAQWHFLTPNSVDLKKVLPPPPTPGSPGAEADLETILQVQASRTPEHVAWAKAIEQENVFKNAAVVGTWFSADNLPVTAEFVKAVMADGSLASRGAKELFNRPRPPKTDSRVQACVEVPNSSGYPSGHASQAWMWATILSELFPEKRAELAEHARMVSWGRVIGGVHFPTDIMAGKILGLKIAEEILKNPAAQAALQKCREEMQPFLLKKAA